MTSEQVSWLQTLAQVIPAIWIVAAVEMRPSRRSNVAKGTKIVEVVAAGVIFLPPAFVEWDIANLMRAHAAEEAWATKLQAQRVIDVATIVAGLQVSSLALTLIGKLLKSTSVGDPARPADQDGGW